VSARAHAEALVAGWVTDLLTLEAVPGADGRQIAIQSEPGPRPGETVVLLPGSTRLVVPVSVLVGDHSVEVSAFVCRNPEENHLEVYRWLLNRNARLRTVAFAVDSVGDIYLRGRLPVEGLTTETVDALVGEALDVADSAFNELIARGFPTSVRTEWAYRTSRGQSTANLRAFRHLIEDPPPG
jgi:hypothetical protein